MFIVYTTCANKKEAEKTATLLIKARLAGCIQIFPANSIYFWKGKVEKCSEVALFIKTEKKLFGMIESLIKRTSSYDTPCIMGWDANKVSAPYKNWLANVLGGQG